MGIETMTIDGLDYAMVMRRGFAVGKSEFCTEPDSSMQFGVLVHDAGYTETPHTHPKIDVKADIFQMLYVTKGELAVDFFSSKGAKTGEVIVSAGDAILIMEGAHAIRVLKDMECITVKQGPYAGIARDKIVLPAQAERNGGGTESADMNRGLRKLSIFLPVYNEAESLKVMIKILAATVDVPYEILVIYDFPEDNSVQTAKELQQKFRDIRLIFNDLGPGVSNAVKKGLAVCDGDVILIALVDEVFPIAAIADMLELMTAKGCDFVSCTRYALGGKRLGGSLIGGILSRLANKMFRLTSGCVLSDATTGIKMARRSIFEKISIEARVGWAFAFELSIKAQLLGLKIGEVPVVSVDRLFGGDSTFRIGPWMSEYLKWFFWGTISLNRSKAARQTRALTLDKHSAKEKG